MRIQQEVEQESNRPPINIKIVKKLDKAVEESSQSNIDAQTLSISQAKRAIKIILNMNGITDNQRIDAIFKQTAPKGPDGSTQVPILRQILLLKAKQIMFRNSALPNESRQGSQKLLQEQHASCVEQVESVLRRVLNNEDL